MNTPLHNTWEWKTLLVECPTCGNAVSPDVASNHANWHWLTNTEPKTLEAHE